MSIVREGMTVKPGYIRIISSREAEYLKAEQEALLEQQLDADSMEVGNYLRYVNANEHRRRCLIFDLIEAVRNDLDIEDFLSTMAFENRKEVREFLVWGE